MHKDESGQRRSVVVVVMFLLDAVQNIAFHFVRAIGELVVVVVQRMMPLKCDCENIVDESFEK